MSEARKGVPKSEAHKANISAANKGKVRVRNNHGICRCGSAYVTASIFTKFCSEKCKKAARGHGLVHAPEFQRFEKKCAICSKDSELVGDHDHATGAPRGILCRSCNLALGNMFDNPDRLRAAAAYLESK